MLKGKIIDIFSSLQGEGIRLGERQLFVRFAGCNLDCRYCDTPESKVADRFKEMDVDEVLAEIEKLNEGKPHHTVSITGGEPLLHEAFLREFLPELKKQGFEIYLDTNGTLPQALEKILSWCDLIAMDIKLHSDCNLDFWDSHRQFLHMGRNKIFVKVVLTSRTSEEEIKKVIHVIQKINDKIILVLQPVTVVPGVEAPSPDMILSWWEMARKGLLDARLIPQKHLEWNIK